MHEADGVAPRREICSAPAFRAGKRIGQRAGKFLKRQVDDPPDHPRADAADGFVDGHDAAHFGGVRFSAPSNSNCGLIISIRPGRAGSTSALPCRTMLCPGLKAFVRDNAREKICRQRSGVVPHQQVIDAAARARISHQAAARTLRLHGVGLPGSDVADFGEVDAVLVAERQIAEKILKRAQPALGQQFGAMRPHAFQVHQFG